MPVFPGCQAFIVAVGLTLFKVLRLYILFHRVYDMPTSPLPPQPSSHLYTFKTGDPSCHPPAMEVVLVPVILFQGLYPM